MSYKLITCTDNLDVYFSRENAPPTVNRGKKTKGKFGTKSQRSHESTQHELRQYDGGPKTNKSFPSKGDYK